MKEIPKKKNYTSPCITTHLIFIEDTISGSSIVEKALLSPGDENGNIYIEYEQGSDRNIDI